MGEGRLNKDVIQVRSVQHNVSYISQRRALSAVFHLRQLSRAVCSKDNIDSSVFMSFVLHVYDVYEVNFVQFVFCTQVLNGI